MNTIKFTKTMGKWTITGPVEQIIAGETVTVTKADGTEKRVYIRTASTHFATEGNAIGYFEDADEREAAEKLAEEQEAYLEQLRIERQLEIQAMEARIQKAREDAAKPAVEDEADDEADEFQDLNEDFDETRPAASFTFTATDTGAARTYTIPDQIDFTATVNRLVTQRFGRDAASNRQEISEEDRTWRGMIDGRTYEISEASA